MKNQLDIKHPISFLFLSALISLSQFGIIHADDYFPLTIGNTWNFKYESIDSVSSLPDIIFDTTRVDNKIYYKFGYNEDYPYLISADSLGRIWRRIDDRELVWFDFTVNDSGCYEYQPFADAEGYSYRVRGRRNIFMKTFAGTFTNCMEFFFDDTTGHDDEQWYTFAPNVGIVRKQYASVKMLLSSAIINGEIITKVSQHVDAKPDNFALHVYPNPFTHQTQIIFHLPRSEYITLKLYNVKGAEVKNVFTGALASQACTLFNSTPSFCQARYISFDSPCKDKILSGNVSLSNNSAQLL